MMRTWLKGVRTRVLGFTMIVLMAVGGLVVGGGLMVGCKTVVLPEQPDQRPELRRRADKEHRELERRTKKNDDEEYENRR